MWFYCLFYSKSLYSIDDKNRPERDEVLSNRYYGNCNTQANLDKAIDLRKEILTDYLSWLKTCALKKELAIPTRDSAIKLKSV